MHAVVAGLSASSTTTWGGPVRLTSWTTASCRPRVIDVRVSGRYDLRGLAPFFWVLLAPYGL
jgi:hypothetical protein